MLEQLPDVEVSSLDTKCKARKNDYYDDDDDDYYYYYYFYSLCSI